MNQESSNLTTPKKIFTFTFLTIFIFASILIYSFYQTKDARVQSIHENIVYTAKTHFETVKELQDWHTDNLSKYVYDKKTDVKSLKKLTHNKMLKQFSRYSRGFHAFYYKLTSLNSKTHTLDEFELKGLSYLEKNLDKEFYFTDIKGSVDKGTFDFIGALQTRQECLKCHIDKKVGERIGGIRITVDTLTAQEEILDIEDLFIKEIIVTLLIAIIISIIIYYLVNRIYSQNKVLNQLTIDLKGELKKNKEQEELLIAQSRQAAMGEMISMIAHQWRQPITVISMDANTLLMNIDFGIDDPQQSKEVAQEILDQVNYLTKTIDDFSDFFKPNKEKTIQYPNRIVEDSLSIIGKSLENHGISLIKVYNDKQKIKTHARELQQVLINILKNAKEAFEKDEENEHRNIIIKIEEIDDNVEISIVDNAGGIPKEIINSIFNPYFSTKKEKNGTGLGLYMSKTIVEKHLKGQIKVQTVDDTTQFNIILPLKED